jgi:hypothetical protein
MNKKKKIDKSAKPFAVLACVKSCQRKNTAQARATTYNDTFVPSEHSKLIQSCSKVPSSGDIASNEDTESQEGNLVHEVRAASSS